MFLRQGQKRRKNTPGERVLGHVNNLTGLRSGNHPLEIRVFTAFEAPFLAFSCALDATLLLLLLFLFAGTFSLAFIHAFSWHVNNILDAWRTAIRSRLVTVRRALRAAHQTRPL